MCSVLVLVWSSALQAGTPGGSGDLASESLEDLMNIKVTSVSKTEQSLSRTAAAVFVITQEDIRHSGATSIPDLLRMVPGMDVAQIDAHTWAISARGLNGRFSNKLLVLVDGRSVYTPTFGGVFWDVLDIPLKDIDRIEVIRGPGGSVWGANAVNGVINIITKKSGDTPGAMLEAGGGNAGQAFGTLQYGGTAKGTDFRVFEKFSNYGSSPSLTGLDGADGWHILRGGFRSDTNVSSKDSLTFQGDLYSGREDLTSTVQPINMQVNFSGGFVQGIWNHTYSPRSDMSLQISFDRYEREDVLGENRRTLDLSFQDHFRWGKRQDLTWGFEYRRSVSHAPGSFFVSLVPPDVTMQLFGSFLQDEIAISPDRLYLTIGAKLEDNHYTGFAALPSVRVAFTPSPNRMIWAALSRVDRTPAEIDTSLRVNIGTPPSPGGPPVFLRLTGNPFIQNEEATVFEAGFRTAIAKRLTLDFSAYYGDYDHQQTAEPASPFFENSPPPPHLVVPIIYANLMHGEIHGLEASANWKPAARWTLSPGYAFEQIHMHLAPGSRDTTSVAQAQGSSPVNSAQLRSSIVLWRNVNWDASAYFVDRLLDPATPAYTRVDTQLSFQLSERGVLSLVGQNLVRDHHQEFTDSTGSVAAALVKRSVYAKLNWQF
jgi:iron complex outermembrane recepter protein